MGYRVKRSLFRKIIDQIPLVNAVADVAEIIYDHKVVAPAIEVSEREYEVYLNLIKEGKEDEAIRYANIYKHDLKEGMGIYTDSADILLKQGKYQRAIDIYNESLDYYRNRKDIINIDSFQTLFNRSKAYYGIGNIRKARSDCYAAIIAYEDHKKLLKRDEDGPGFTGDPDFFDSIRSEFCRLEREYIDIFLSIPHNQRKILVPVRKYTTLEQDNIVTVKLDNMSNGLKFPIGHPIANQVYVCHPYLTHKYIPYENYELEFVEDRVREFCQIVQYLGATEVSIKAINSNAEDGQKDASMEVSGGGGYKDVQANGSYKSKMSQRLINEISQSMALNQKYAPSNDACLPDNLVWYNNESSWQRLYQQRMQGALLHYEERFETRKAKVIESNELKSIAADCKYLFASLDINWSSSMSEKFSEQENAILSITVDFAPLASLGSGVVNTPQYIPSNTASPDEMEYLDEYKECLAESGEITSSERRLLKRLQKSLDISDERVAELKASLAPVISLTDDEKDYLEEYNLCSDGGEITDSERRLLNRLRGKLGISEERAAEIEMLK